MKWKKSCSPTLLLKQKKVIIYWKVYIRIRIDEENLGCLKLECLTGEAHFYNLKL